LLLLLLANESFLTDSTTFIEDMKSKLSTFGMEMEMKVIDVEPAQTTAAPSIGEYLPTYSVIFDRLMR